MRSAAEVEAMRDLLYRRQFTCPTSDSAVPLEVLSWVVDPRYPDLWLWEHVEAGSADDELFTSARDACEGLVHWVGIDPGEEEPSLLDHLGNLSEAEVIELARVAGRLQRICQRVLKRRKEGK